tara:strand:+ start:1485 stop:1679 length:195 start_codon:yes stop_codon:yes gene_type:complete
MRQQLVQPLPEDIATRIKLVQDIIVDLADSLDTEEDLWEAYKLINKGLSYLNAKHTMTQVKEEE